jgi:hypothetical protein
MSCPHADEQKDKKAITAKAVDVQQAEVHQAWIFATKYPWWVNFVCL